MSKFKKKKINHVCKILFSTYSERKTSTRSRFTSGHVSKIAYLKLKSISFKQCYKHSLYSFRACPPFAQEIIISTG